MIGKFDEKNVLIMRIDFILQQRRIVWAIF